MEAAALPLVESVVGEVVADAVLEPAMAEVTGADLLEAAVDVGTAPGPAAPAPGPAPAPAPAPIVIQPSRVILRAPPRFRAPLGADKIKFVANMPSVTELLESVNAVMPAEVPGQTLGTGVGVAKPTTTLGRAPKPVIVRASAPTAATAVAATAVAATAVEAPSVEAMMLTKVKTKGPPVIELEPLAEGAPAPASGLQAIVDLIKTTERSKVQVHPKDEVFVPSNRKSFTRPFIIQSFWRYKLKPLPDIPDPDACAKAAAYSKTEVKTFEYQAFVRDYMQRPSPYRGILVYHGLGSGKTCTSIATMEALYSAGQKPIYIFTPASLSANYRDEITKCGPYIFRTNNHWVWVPIPTLKPVSADARLVIEGLGLPPYIVKKQKGAWVPHPGKAANFESLTIDQRRQIQEQIMELINSRFKFIHYNGLLEEDVRNWACEDPTKFDGATIIIDEVHNLIRTINNSNLEAFYKDEPRSLAQYHPRHCATGKKYRISYLLYRMLANAVGCKIVALSATPIINFPQELAILANVLAGDMRMAEINSSGLDKQQLIKNVLARHPEVDFVEVMPRPDVNNSLIRFSPVPSGFRKVIDPASGTMRGFVRDATLTVAEAEINRERDLETWFARVSTELAKAGITFADAPKLTSVTRLPDIEKQFRELFIDTEKLEVKPVMKLPLMARLSGLISYYKGGKADLMAKVTRDDVIEVDMSDQQLKRYTEVRKPEIDKELRSKTKPMTTPDGVYSAVNQNQNSTFKIFSRAACNFAFPEEVARPIPANFRDQLRMIGEKLGKAAATGEDVPADAEEAAGDVLVTDETQQEANADAVAGAGAAPESEEPSSYSAALTNAVAVLKANAAKYFSRETLPFFSPKFQAVINNLGESRGPALVYSNFKTLEGVGLFGLALETQVGYKKFDIVQQGGTWVLSPETSTATAGTPRYITYTGDEDRVKRNILLAIFNGKWSKVPGGLAKQVQELTGTTHNQQGAIARVFMITQSGAEGISLSNVRQVHIMEPYWNYVRLDQVKGRAIRICSHMDLAPEERTVDVFTYVSKFSERQLREKMVDETLQNFDSGETTDQSVLRLLNAKKHLADSLMDVMQKSAVDCDLNATENGVAGCYTFAGAPSMDAVYHPLVEVHVNEAATAVRAAT